MLRGHFSWYVYIHSHHNHIVSNSSRFLNSRTENVYSVFYLKMQKSQGNSLKKRRTHHISRQNKTTLIKPMSVSTQTNISIGLKSVMPRPYVPRRRPPESRVKAKRQGSLMQVRTWSLRSTTYKRALNDACGRFL